ncbi:MAG: hypothetical protein ACM3PW_11015 [Chlamydiota bacterium]
MLRKAYISSVAVLIVVCCFSPPLQGQGACAFCRVLIPPHSYNKCYSCPLCATYSTGWGCDIDSNCTTYAECFYCGCCNYIPGTGGVCYDPYGGQCHRESCPGITSPVARIVDSPWITDVAFSSEIKNLIGLKEPLSGREALLASSPWIADPGFQEQIAAIAPQVAVIVRNYQTHFAKGERVHYVEGHTIDGKMLVDNISYKIFTTKFGKNWRLEIQPDPDDPDSAHAPILAKDVPNALEILGRRWKLIHHIHGRETSEAVIATGTY